MKPLPMGMRELGVKRVTVIRNPGADDESSFELDAHIQSKAGYFPVDAPIYEGDVVEYPDPRGGTTRKIASKVDVHDVGSDFMQHISVTWGSAPAQRVAPVRRIGLEALHPTVISAATDLFVDGHYSQSIFEALKALEARVREQGGLQGSGRPLMTEAFSGNPPPIDVSVEKGQSGKDEQEGFRFLFMGAVQGIRNPKGHELVKQDDPQRALEYLAFVSVLFRRLDDAAAKASTTGP